MKFVLVFLLVVGCALAFPRPPQHRRISHQSHVARLRRTPVAAARRHIMLIHGFHRPHVQRRQGYDETAMSAFAAGDSVAAGSYLGSGQCPTCVEQDQEFIGAPEPNEEPIIPLAEAPLSDPIDLPLSDPSEDTELAPPLPKPLRKPKAPVKKPVDDDEEEDEVEDYVPSKGRKGSNTYFPIVFGAGGARTGAGGPSGSGGVTAIANSYSSGKGGVANSHATAYGSGSSAASKRRSKRPLDDEEGDDE